MAMKYQGYEISKQVLPGADFVVLKNGSIRNRTPKKEDVDYYYATNINTGTSAANCKTLEEMKEHINKLNEII
jgi:hypothetical protein